MYIFMCMLDYNAKSQNHVPLAHETKSQRLGELS